MDILFKLLVFASLTLLLLCDSAVAESGSQQHAADRKLAWVRFLVSVNDTWDPDGCIATVATERIAPNVAFNRSEKIYVGSCDQGPLQYQVSQADDRKNMTINLVFHSSVIEDAGPPTCQITWPGSYLVPSKMDASLSLLPGCVTGDSREGYHMTYYWFYLLDWMFVGEQ